MRIVAIGSRVFVTSFQLAGVQGIKADSSSDALTLINRIGVNNDIGLILLSTKQKVDYRALLKQILGV